MKNLTWVLLGGLCGIFAALIISEMIGIVGVLVFDRAIGVRYLPVFLGVAGAVLGPWIASRARGTARRNHDQPGG